jgi:outer membrane protein
MPLLVLLFPFQVEVAAAGATAAATATSTVTIDDAVGAALANHPDVVAAGAQTDIADAQARQARAPLLPSVDLTGRYGYSWRDSGGNGDLPDDVEGRGGGSDSYSASLSGGLLLWDFGQTRNRWRSALAGADAAEGDAEAVRQGIVLDARLAFLDALETRALIDVARESLGNQERHLAQTEEFVKIGTRPEIDLAKLRTDVATARSALIRAENDHRTAKSRLNRAMGVRGSIEYEVAAAPLPALAAENQPTAELYAAAVGHRPEHMAQRASILGQEADVRAARRWLLPSLRLGADATYSGEDFGDPGLGASVGVTLSWNLFDGLSSPAAKDAAEAQLVVQKARLNGVEQQVWQEIEQARIAVASARAELESAELGVGSARELLRLAEERYQAGVGNSLELSDAQLALANASAQRVRVEYDVAAARAQLLRALGRRDWR